MLGRDDSALKWMLHFHDFWRNDVVKPIVLERLNPHASKIHVLDLHHLLLIRHGVIVTRVERASQIQGLIVCHLDARL